MALPAEGVMWDAENGRHVVVLVLAADDAEEIGKLFGSPTITALSEEARALDEPVVWVPVGVPDV